MQQQENTVAPHFCLGLDTHKVPMSMYKYHRERLVERLKNSAEGITSHSFILLEGGKSIQRYDTDHEPLFRQESNFHYLFGVTEADFYGAIDVENNKAVLFIPRLAQEYAIWLGHVWPCAFYKEKYQVDEAHYVDELETFFKGHVPSVIYTLYGLNTDSRNYAQEAKFPGIENFRVDNARLHPELVECRVFKTPGEIELLRYVNRITCAAHETVMQRCKPGMMEYQLESIFLHEVYLKGGCRFVSYTCICSSGSNSAILHYGHSGEPNSKQVNDGDIMLFDMGAEYSCYASDVTCSFPANGKFTEDQKIIYESVLAAQQAVLQQMKPGVKWPDMHRLANRVICEELKRHGLLKGSVDDMQKHHIGALFMPHGLGHFMGLDTHDVGGYNLGHERIQEPGLSKLRTVRELQEGMVITVEPGIYFITSLLLPAFADPEKSQFLNEERIRQFLHFGGVRLEDDVVVTATGIDNLTVCPRTVAQVEACMAGRPWRELSK